MSKGDNEKKDETEKKEEANNETKESRVGKRLSELTTKRVIILVLTLLLCIPLFSSDYYYEEDKGFTYDLLNLASMYENGVNSSVLETGFNIVLKLH